MRLSYIAVLVGLLGVSGFSQTVLVQPYLQPGGDSTLEVFDSKVVAWVTDQKAGDFIVEYGPSPAYGTRHRRMPAPLAAISP